MRNNPRDRLLTFADLICMIRFLFLLILGWIFPLSRLWSALVPLAIVHSYARHPFLAGFDWFPEAVARTSYPDTARSFHIAMLQFMYHETALLIYLLRNKRGRLSIKLTGQEHITNALSHDRGVILLVAKVAYSDFVPKAAMFEAGIPVCHLSSSSHGSSGSRFGRKIITRIRFAAENRFIHQRFVISSDNSVQPLKALERNLRMNGVVSISAVPGVRSVPIPFLGGTIELGRAAPALCRMTGSEVLPVITVRNGKGDFEVKVGASLKDGGKETNLENAIARRYGACLENFVCEFPTAWGGWFQWQYAGKREDSPLAT